MSDSAPDELAIFTELLEKTGAQRDEFLAAACGSDHALRKRIERYLRAHQEKHGPLDEPLAHVAALTIDEPPVEKPGTQIGPYKLLQVIGQGGMGVVYMTEQTEPVERRVALKIIKPGMDTRQVIARFEAERQALAMMDHPNIAKVLDGGATDSGRPYFLMELVKGVAITQYCDQHHLTPRQRLELFMPVCQAVQHAHQKGIIHRDIKPTNVLVAEYDDRAVPKIIDFGVAKAIQQRLTERTVFTQLGQVVGTIDYMSPEQAKLNQLDVDTRSDIYSLGVLLYELLTGETPFDRQRLRSAAFDDLLRIIREEDPPRPSLRLSSSESLPSIAANRLMEPNKLSTLVRGELDWIVMKALEKDRGRRYETAASLARDIENYLHDEPVTACPPSRTYRLQKFLRRNKGPATAVVVVLLTLLGGVMGTTWGLVWANRARLAEARRAGEQRRAMEEAQAREAETQAVLDFVENQVFAAARPAGLEGGLGYDVRLRDALEVALPLARSRFQDHPLIDARLRYSLGVSLACLGEAAKAVEQFEAAHKLYSTHRGRDDRDTLRCMNSLAASYVAVGRHSDGLKLHEETLARRQAVLGPDHPDTLTSMQSLADAYLELGRYAEARKLNQKTLALRSARLGPHDRDTLRTMHALANSLTALGQMAEALKLSEETLALRKAAFGTHDYDTLGSMHELACIYWALDRNDEALRLQEETLAVRKATLGLDHPHTLGSMEHLSLVLFQVGRRHEALKLHEETLARLRARLGSEHPYTLQSMCNLAGSYVADGQYAAALRLYQESLDVRTAKLGAHHRTTLDSLCGVAECLLALDRGAEAVQMIDKCLKQTAKDEVDPTSISALALLRLRPFEKAKDIAGCQATAELWETLLNDDAEHFYCAACLRAVTATVIRDSNDEHAAQNATAEVDRAMTWLQRAVRTGFGDVDRMRADADLDALRDRKDFQKLCAELEAAENTDD